MPLRAAQLFVRCRSLDELGEAVGRALQKERPPGEVSLLGLHQGDWGTLLLPAPDDALARALSERFGTALFVDLDGGRLALAVQTWESGEPGEPEVDPRPPHFRDVEAAAWDLLQYLGVPPALRLLRLAQVEVLAGESETALPAVLAQAGPQRLELRTVPALPPARAEGAPPVEPDVVVESKAGEARALEMRTLPGGIPTAAWAQALAAVEEAQALRLLHAFADGDEPRMPRPAFAYRSPQALRVEKLLAAARRERPWLWALLDPEREAPLTRGGFTALCQTGLAGVLRAHGKWLEVESGDGAVLRAPVGKIYQVYLQTLDAEVAARQLAAETRALLETPAGPLRAEHLLPTLVAGDPGDRAARPLGNGVFAALLADDGTRVAPVTTAALAALGLDENSAFERAVRRADALTEAAPEGLRWFDLEHGRVVACAFDDAGGAGRLLSPRARALLLRILGEDEALAIAPTRDALLACAAFDDEGRDFLRDEAQRRFAEGPYPVAPGLWRLSASSVAPEPDPDSPLG